MNVVNVFNALNVINVLKLTTLTTLNYPGHCVANRFALARMSVLLACRFHEERQHHRYQSRALYESGGQDHVCADVTNCFWLTGNAFNGFTTNRSYTDTGADSG
jgi:hypothetical protein